MGIPVPTRRSAKSSPMKYTRSQTQRRHGRTDELDANEPPQPDEKQKAEVSRMGNYFNIVIAPPPIRALQPRKLVPGDAFHLATKTI